MKITDIFPEDLLLGTEYIQTSTLSHHPIIALYFTASYCPPCKIFTPQLVEFEKKYKIPVIIISRDKTQQAYDEYRAQQPNHYAVDYKLISRRSECAEKFNIKTIPSLIILDNNCDIITSNGRNEIEVNPQLAITKWKYIASHQE